MVTTTTSPLKKWRVSGYFLLTWVSRQQQLHSNNAWTSKHSNPLSIAAQLFIVYHSEALSEGKSNKIRRIGGTWNHILTFCVYEVCILKDEVFPVQNSHSCCGCWLYHFHCYWFAPLSRLTTWACTSRFRARSLIWITETFRQWTGQKQWQTSPFTSLTVNYNSKTTCGHRHYL